jgi:hypothetical protein
MDTAQGLALGICWVPAGIPAKSQHTLLFRLISHDLENVLVGLFFVRKSLNFFVNSNLISLEAGFSNFSNFR